jgi:hypothetical protein
VRLAVGRVAAEDHGAEVPLHLEAGQLALTRACGRRWSRRPARCRPRPPGQRLSRAGDRGGSLSRSSARATAGRPRASGRAPAPPPRSVGASSASSVREKSARSKPMP